MSEEPDNDYCPSCRVPFTEHLGLAGTCKHLQMAEDAAEKGRLARENAAGMEMQIQDLESTVHRLRSALEGVLKIVPSCSEPWNIIEGALKPWLSPSAPSGTNSVQTGSKSVIAPAGQDNSQKQYYLPPDTRKAGVSALAEGEWREFRPSQSNPIQMGDQYRPKPELAISWQQGWSDIEGWIGMTQASENLIYRRLRPATKEE